MHLRFWGGRGCGRPALGAAVLAGLMGCASGPAPEADVTAAALALDQAEEANAPTLASGAYDVARDKLERARAAMEDGDAAVARHLAAEAQVDAQFATAEARSAVARQNATELQQSIEALRDELGRRVARTS